MPPLSGRSEIKYGYVEEAEIIAESIEGQCQLNDAADDEDKELGEEFWRSFTSTYHISSMEELNSLIKNPKKRKAPSGDVTKYCSKENAIGN